MNVLCCIMVRTFTFDDSDSSYFKVKSCNGSFGESTWKDWGVSRGLIKHWFPSCLQKYFQRRNKLGGNCCQQGKPSSNWLELKTGKQKETPCSSSFSRLFSLAVALEQHMQSSGFESWDVHQWLWGPLNLQPWSRAWCGSSDSKFLLHELSQASGFLASLAWGTVSLVLWVSPLIHGPSLEKLTQS